MATYKPKRAYSRAPEMIKSILVYSVPLMAFFAMVFFTFWFFLGNAPEPNKPTRNESPPVSSTMIRPGRPTLEPVPTSTVHDTPSQAPPQAVSTEDMQPPGQPKPARPEHSGGLSNTGEK